MASVAEYIWLDGTKPTQKLRSKWRAIEEDNYTSVLQFPNWNFDGSSTNQSEGNSSDLTLRPVRFCPDPIRGPGNFLVLCEIPNHETNARKRLKFVLDNGADKEEPWFGFEQEYTLFDGRVPLGWPRDRGVMPPQGPYYCGVGADEVFGRDLVEEHMRACMDANLLYYGGNAEVMPGQWEFQIGHRGLEEDPEADPLLVTDHLLLARWILYRLSEKYGITATIEPKPMSGDWNGAGMHTNFSTKSMRDKDSGKEAMTSAISHLERTHSEHIKVYGAGNANRLTGLHETCDINTFKSGVKDRGASIRIPEEVEKKGFGYLEDRRPAANANPYEVAAIILESICKK